MGIVHDHLGSTCAECGKEDVATAVTWEKKVITFGTMMSSVKNVVLCPPCAVFVGAMLIGDAREASVAFPEVPLERPEEVANPHLVTKRLRDNDPVME